MLSLINSLIFMIASYGQCLVLSCHQDAAEQCVAVDFIMLEAEAAFMYGGVSENANSLVNGICDLENCVVRRYNPGNHLLVLLFMFRIIR